MNYVDLAFQTFEAACHDVVVKSEGAHVTEHFVGETHLSPCEGRVNPHTGRKRPVYGARKDGDVGAGVSETLNLLPGGVADTACADLVGKAVKDSDSL